MENDHEMVIRMFAYDVHFAITHAKNMNSDTGEITLKIPTVKIQSYSLDEIRNKHLTLFLPYTILRFRIQKTARNLPKKN
ncbi:MAG: hypothetical protein NC433_13590 [Clostridiales bacterium]|nr:hypothetical protein [Clostridiales bacterium]